MPLYIHMIPSERDPSKPSIVYKNDQDIIYEYWDYWKYKMEEKHGKNHVDITPDNCIRDWVIIHQAREVKD